MKNKCAFLVLCAGVVGFVAGWITRSELPMDDSVSSDAPAGSEVCFGSGVCCEDEEPIHVNTEDCEDSM